MRNVAWKIRPISRDVIMKKLYEVTAVKWNITSNEIDYISLEKPKTYRIHMKDDLSSEGIVLSEGMMEFVKDEFPEHCLSIRNYVPNEFFIMEGSL